MDLPLIELFLEEITGEMRKGATEIERMSAEVERMKAEIESIRQNRTKLEAAVAGVKPLLTRPEIAISREQVTELARKFWAERGYTDGGHEEDWFRAEQELRDKAPTAPVDVTMNVDC